MKTRPWMVIALLVLTAAAGFRAAAKDGPPAKPDPADELALLPPDSLGFVQIRFDKQFPIDLLKLFLLAPRLPGAGNIPDDFEREFVAQHSVTPAEVRSFSWMLLAPTGNDATGLESVGITATKPLDKTKYLRGQLQNARQEVHKGRKYYVAFESGNYSQIVHFPSPYTAIICSRPAFLHMVDSAGGAMPAGLKKGLELANGPHPIVGALDVPEPVAAALMQEKLPPFLNVYRGLLDARSAALTVDVAAEAKLKLAMVFADEAKAKKGKESADLLLTTLKLLGPAYCQQMEKRSQTPVLRRFFADSQTMLKTATANRSSDRVDVEASLKTDLQSLASLLATVHHADDFRRLEDDERGTSRSNLRRLITAMHNYAATRGDKLPPPAIYGKDGKPLLSWRVAILPYIEHDALYRQFKKDEPWDSAHNKKLLSAMPKIYAPLGLKTKEPHTTFYRVFTGIGTIFEDEHGFSLIELTQGDGTSNTIALVEAGEPVPWTKPADLAYDAKKPLPKLGGLFNGDFHVAFCDATVRYVKKDFDESILRLAITWNDGKVLDFEKINK